ncbi:MAG TPA: aminoacetone oxidase family FAD-binding enzyme [Candidatus Gastranaerophilaceae bacterium]|nr:aminoacetone oxidase family FAD-binding enzyme [Candidatus Gastranaerophilaceae bacterium]
MVNRKFSVAIIGAGPAGCMCAYFASKNADVILFDYAQPLHTLLYTGGGRCNLAYAQYDFKELAKNYPRGEKFLYSIFSQFSTADTVEFFEKIGVKTYTQQDLRIFPISNSAKEVKEKMLKSIKNCTIKKEKVIKIKPLTLPSPYGTPHPNPLPQGERESNYNKIFSPRGEGKEKSKFLITTDKNNYSFDKVVIATGGHAGFDLAQSLGHKIIKPKPSLVGLISNENFSSLKGLSLKNIKAQVFFNDRLITKENEDILFTHQGVSGPLIYKISSLCARLDYNRQNPLKIKLEFIPEDFDLQIALNSNVKKNIKNLLCEFVPKSMAEYILGLNNIKVDDKCSQINSQKRDLIKKSLSEFEINAISPTKEGEIVTSGGICLDEINSKTMESKLTQGLYFCGEVINVDGFCGGFNLQNCWSTGFVAGSSVTNSRAGWQSRQ